MAVPVRHVVVTPVYEDREAATRLFHQLSETLGGDAIVVAVDDGSLHRPLLPSAIETASLDGVVVRLRRNVGHQRAIAVGLCYVAEHFPEATCIVLDSDGEDRPETIKELLAPLQSDDIDVAVAERKNRLEPLGFKLFYFLYKCFFKTITGRSISFGNFMALKPQAIKRLVAMQELWIHVAACVLVSRLRISLHPLDRGPRYTGQSKMDFSGLVLHGVRAFIVFAEDVLVRVSTTCAAVAILSFLAIVATVLLKATGMTTPGWFSITLGILLLALLQTGTLAFMTLMLTGIARNANTFTINYRDLVDEILPTKSRARSSAQPTD